MANEEKIRILDEQPAENAGSLLYIRTLAGSSDASKPTSLLANGSVYIETDTGKVFIFDEDDGWTEMQVGGGSSGGGVLVIHETVEGTTHTLDKTWQEIHDFSGIPVVIGDTPDGDGTMRKFDSVITVRDDPSYIVTTWDYIEYTASSASGYPSYTE